jgi:hypothetical protein
MRHSNWSWQPHLNPLTDYASPVMRFNQQGQLGNERSGILEASTEQRTAFKLIQGSIHLPLDCREIDLIMKMAQVYLRFNVNANATGYVYWYMTMYISMPGWRSRRLLAPPAEVKRSTSNLCSQLHPSTRRCRYLSMGFIASMCGIFSNRI